MCFELSKMVVYVSLGACKFIYRFAWYISRQKSMRAVSCLLCACMCSCTYITSSYFHFLSVRCSLKPLNWYNFPCERGSKQLHRQRHDASVWNLYVIFLRFCLLLICWFIAEECVYAMLLEMPVFCSFCGLKMGISYWMNHSSFTFVLFGIIFG